MAIQTETLHAGEFVLSEGNGSISRETVTFIAGGNLPAGQVVGVIAKGAATATAQAGNTGNGTVGSITVGTDSKAGVHKVVLLSATDFEVEDPDGVNLGTGATGAAFSGGGLTFTITAGATAFAAGDAFDVTVAAGSGKYAAYSATATDGTEVAVAILYAPLTTSAADRKAVVVARLAEVAEDALTGLDAAANADLAARNIFAR